MMKSSSVKIPQRQKADQANAITTYSILTYQQICKDSMSRSKLLTDFKIIVDRRIKIQYQYLIKMKELASSPEMKKISNPIRGSQIIYNSLINAINVQVDGINNHVGRMDTQITKQLLGLCQQYDIYNKREIVNAGIIVRDYEKKHEDIDRMKNKLSKKSTQLKKLKQQYIIGTLVDMPFDRKNKLFIRTKQIQEGFKPLRDQFQREIKNFNERTVNSIDKLNQVVKKIQNCEHQKVELMKKIFIVLQISNSQYGANLIQDKASILSKLNNLEVTNPDYKKCNKEQFEQLKKQMIAHETETCSYINSLFTNIVDTKNFQNLHKYGSEFKHRQSISSCIQSIQTQLVQEEQPQLQFVKNIATGFKMIFNKDAEYDPEKVKKLQQLMQNSPEGRKTFILCFQKFRTLGIFEMSQQKKQHIQHILIVFLNQCLSEYDTYNSKLLLVLAQTYYFAGQDNQPVYLSNFIYKHRIWKDLQWWQCALLQTCYQQLKLKSKKAQEPPITIWHIKGAGFKNSEGQNQNATQLILFNQLIFFVTNMRNLSIKQEAITYLAKKYIKHFQLSPKIAADIISQLKVAQVSNQYMQQDFNSPNGSPALTKRRGGGFGLSRRLFSRG